MTYRAETWTLTTKLEKILSPAQYNMKRSMLKITYKDRKTENWVRDQTIIGITEIIKTRNGCNAALTAKEIEEGDEKGGEMNCTGPMRTGT